MKRSDVYFITAFVVLAPHGSVMTAMVCGVVFGVYGAYLAFKGR